MTADDTQVWAKLAAPLRKADILWRIDGRPTARGDKFFARYVAYVDAHTVRERLDSVVPGQWDSELELLPPRPSEDGEDEVAFKCRLTVLGVAREDVGTGADYKTAASDALKRAAVRFGIASELYAYEQNWVQVDGDGKYAKPVEDPAVAYTRRHGGTAPAPQKQESAPAPAPKQEAPAPEAAPSEGEPSCPKCGGQLWDNRTTKRNPKAPDWKCRDKTCDGVIWPPKPGKGKKAEPARTAPADDEEAWMAALVDTPDDLPF